MITQKQIPFTSSQYNLTKMAYNDCVYAWLLVHSYNDRNEDHNFIYKDTFTFQDIARDIHRHRQTIAKRFNELLEEGFLKEREVFGKTAYIMPRYTTFEYLDGETVIKLLNLPLKDQKEELIKTLVYILKQNYEIKEQNQSSFRVSSSEILQYFGHSLGHKASYDRVRMNLTLLQGAGIIKFKTVNYKDRKDMPQVMYVYYVSKKGRASDEWLGKEATKEDL